MQWLMLIIIIMLSYSNALCIFLWTACSPLVVGGWQGQWLAAMITSAVKNLQTTHTCFFVQYLFIMLCLSKLILCVHLTCHFPDYGSSANSGSWPVALANNATFIGVCFQPGSSAGFFFQSGWVLGPVQVVCNNVQTKFIFLFSFFIFSGQWLWISLNWCDSFV